MSAVTERPNFEESVCTVSSQHFKPLLDNGGLRNGVDGAVGALPLRGAVERPLLSAGTVKTSSHLGGSGGPDKRHTSVLVYTEEQTIVGQLMFHINAHRLCNMILVSPNHSTPEEPLERTDFQLEQIVGPQVFNTRRESSAIRQRGTHRCGAG
ncbi:hypothetical protein CABS01_06142 [Colletotrichum abscissum]|uniref:Uncharacterized protein n=1 Tax=Colletotrichum abscissum TaxID=1671311 RepID=A0A9P9X1U5_9PEZI|nr:uncharacterized protein CABS01_06142 [Colletotrichum abscissum]KAI3531490.1 hypothetical protein CABS02_14139 [Colletotrichum abscissum]KAK1518608.1 hypothetical protein CABS01_06142 [Colletotrichum abscissum]